MFNMLEAKTKLSQLVDAAERGEKIVIARNGIPVAQIVPIQKKKFNYGFLKGKMAPIADASLFAMSNKEADLFTDGN